MNKKRDLINICVFYGGALCLVCVLTTITIYDEVLKMIEGKDNAGK